MTGQFAPIGLYNGKLTWKHRTLPYWIAYDSCISAYVLSDVPDPTQTSASVAWGQDTPGVDAAGPYSALTGATGTATVTLT